ncbi:hypothetical protein [Janibacter sp. GXQ6167]|uniref:hypothetical protein n=1 Tax=Janibacter sp. GXQ6167 TaxID=3240791 RepID=UPI003523B2AB
MAGPQARVEVFGWVVRGDVVRFVIEWFAAPVANHDFDLDLTGWEPGCGGYERQAQTDFQPMIRVGDSPVPYRVLTASGGTDEDGFAEYQAVAELVVPSHGERMVLSLVWPLFDLAAERAVELAALRGG